MFKAVGEIQEFACSSDNLVKISVSIYPVTNNYKLTVCSSHSSLLFQAVANELTSGLLTGNGSVP